MLEFTNTLASLSQGVGCRSKNSITLGLMYSSFFFFANFLFTSFSSFMQPYDNFLDLATHLGMVGRFCFLRTSGQVVMVDCDLTIWERNVNLARNDIVGGDIKVF